MLFQSGVKRYLGSKGNRYKHIGYEFTGAQTHRTVCWVESSSDCYGSIYLEWGGNIYKVKSPCVRIIIGSNQLGYIVMKSKGMGTSITPKSQHIE